MKTFAHRSAVRLFFALALVVGINLLSFAQTGTPPSKVVPGTVHPLAVKSLDLGSVDPSLKLQGIQLSFALADAQRAALKTLIAEQQNPKSSNYHRWLTPAEFGAAFGPSAQNEAAVKNWIAAQGFQEIRMAQARTYVTFTGSAAQAERAFKTQIHSLTRDGEKHFANTTDLSLPSSIAPIVQNVSGLDDFRPTANIRQKLSPQFTAPSGYISFAPGDIATVYDLRSLYSAGIDGAGVTAAIVGQTDIYLSDIADYRKNFGLSVNPPTVVLVPYSGDPGYRAADLGEAHMDLELIGAVARNSTLLYVNSTNVMNSLSYAVDENLAKIISVSYGTCEANLTVGNVNWLDALGQEASAMGITVLVSSGDSGPASCDSSSATTAQRGLFVSYPADSPQFTAVGGTNFVSPAGSYFGTTNDAQGGSALSYIPEVTWNDALRYNELASSGGGGSLIYAKPTWQTGPGVPQDHWRHLPDVSFLGSPWYTVCSEGNCATGTPDPTQGVFGGTSASTPLFAGMVTLLNNYLIQNGNLTTPGLGNVNPNLYWLAQNTGDVFHDVTQGTNIIPCVIYTKDCTIGSYGYSAGPGYDQVTGLGSINAYYLFSKWQSSYVDASVNLSATTDTMMTGNTLSLTAKVTASTGTTVPTGNVQLYSGTYTENSSGVTPVGATLLDSKPIDSTGTASFSVTETAAGSATLFAMYVSDNPVYSAGHPSPIISITVSATHIATTTTLAASADHVATLNPISLVATIVQASGSNLPSGSVAFFSGTTRVGTAIVSGGTATLTTMYLPTGIDSVFANYVATGAFSNSTSPAITITVVTPTPLVVSANNSTRSYGATNPAFTGTVTGALGGDSFVETFTTTATTASNVATYTIVPAVTGANLVSYSVTLNNGSLIVTKAGSSALLAASASSVNLNQSLTISATIVSAATGNPSGTVTFYDGASPIGPGTLLNSVASFTTITLGAGAHSLTAQYAGDLNFTESTASALNVNVVAPGIGASPEALSLTVAQGGSVTDKLTITPQGGYAGTLQFSCNGLPRYATCAFSPATVTASGTGGPESVTVTIQTAGAKSAAMSIPATSNQSPVNRAAIFWIPGLLMAGIAAGRRKLSLHAIRTLIFAVLLGAGGLLTACGGGSKQTTPIPSTTVTPAGTSTVQVEVSGTGGLSQKINLQLTVQ